MKTTLDLWPIGNCQVSALIDRSARIVWGCVPRVDGEPAFSALVAGYDDGDWARDDSAGFWAIEMEGGAVVHQEYVRNTPILVTRFADDAGNAFEVTDFCPRFDRGGRIYRPVAFARIVRPIAGSPRMRMRLRPARDWSGARLEPASSGSHHLRYVLATMAMRLTTDAPIGLIADERPLRVEHPLHFFFGPDESFTGAVLERLEQMVEATEREWQVWVRGLATPFEWQDVVIRAAITLKLCQHEETGAIVAAMTTSIPEHPGSGRNWDYRFCWIRDAYYTVRALNRLGALDVLESYLGYLRNIVDEARVGHIQPLYSVLGEATLDERIEPKLNGYRGDGPVRVGNDAYSQVQHDAYGQIVLSNAQAFFDRRLFRMAGKADFEALEEVGERAWREYDTPDAGLWELRTRQGVHTYSAAMCWCACDRLANAADRLGLEDRRAFWSQRAGTIHNRIKDEAWRADTQRYSATFGEDVLDASVLQLLELQFLEADDPRFLSTLEAVEAGLGRGPYVLRYASEDDFGMPKSAFNLCTFWLIEALQSVGRTEEAKALFAEMLSRRTVAGLLSEDIDPASGELWGNYPQTYSLVGLINCAMQLGRPWSSAR